MLGGGGLSLGAPALRLSPKEAAYVDIVKKVAVAAGGGAAGGMGGLEVVREFLAACKVGSPGSLVTVHVARQLLTGPAPSGDTVMGVRSSRGGLYKASGPDWEDGERRTHGGLIPSPRSPTHMHTTARMAATLPATRR